MPCNDYPDPTPQSRDLQRTTSLLIYTLTKLGHKPAMWMKEQAKNPYAVDERAITELCALLKAMSKINSNKSSTMRTAETLAISQIGGKTTKKPIGSARRRRLRGRNARTCVNKRSKS